MNFSEIINPWGELRRTREELQTFKRLANSYLTDLNSASIQVRGLQIQLESAQASLANALANARKKPGRKPAAARDQETTP